MAHNGETDGGRWRPVWWAAAGAVAGGAATAFAVLLMAIATIVVLAASQRDEEVVLSRNEATQDPSGARIWQGAMLNRTDRPYQDVSVAILFRDRDGAPVAWTGGRVDRLEPGESLDLQAPLPAGAADMQMYSLRWRNAGHSAELGPYKPWPFGYVQAPD